MRAACVDAHLAGALQGDDASLEAMKTDLVDLCRDVRAEHPLIGQAQGASAARSQAIGRVHSLANRISMYAAMCCGHPAAGVPLKTAHAAIEADSQRLHKALHEVYTRSVDGVAASSDRPPQGLIQWVDVPQGAFPFGYEGTVQHVDSFRISKYPVTNRQFKAFVEATGYRPEGSWSPPRGDYPEGDDSPGSHPVTNVTFFDAKAFCRWAGCRLPSETEWEKAARGTDGRKYPWGNEWDPGRCNNDSSGTTPVDRYERAGNVSPYGAVDMVGNVLEWVDGNTTRRPGAVLLKGGAWTNYASMTNQPFDCVRHTSESPESSYRGFGFRVALDGLSEQPPASSSTTDLGWQLADAAGIQSSVPGLRGPGSGIQPSAGLDPVEWHRTPGSDPVERPRTPPVAGRVRDHVARLVESETALEAGANASLVQELGTLVEQVRADHPAGGVGEIRAAVSEVHSAANRLAMYSAFAAAAAPPHGMAVATCVKHLRTTMEDMDRALLTSYSRPVAPLPKSTAPPDLIEWVTVPEGEAVIGRANDRVRMDAFDIGKYPVTNEQFNAFVQATGYAPEGGWHPPESGRYGSEGGGDHPAVNVSFFDAQVFCAWAGCRLPTAQEWEKAARGDDGREFPWGPDWRPDLVNHEGPLTESVHAHESDATGAPGNVSPFGAVDMIGNVLEWVDSPAPLRPGSVLLKGGAWSNSGLRPFNAMRHTSELPNAAYRGFGFRVARDRG